MAEEIKKYDMTLPALEIDAALLAAKNAVSYEPQTPTKAQQTQAIANIGLDGCLPKVIDLDTYGDTPVGTILSTLLFSGGGQTKATGIDKLFADLDTDGPVIIKFTVSGFGTIYVHEATIVKSSNEGVAAFSFECVATLNGGIVRVTVIMNSTGAIAETIATLPLPD